MLLYKSNGENKSTLKKIADNFSQAAGTYELASQRQNIAQQPLKTELTKLSFSPQNILDLGSGTGQMSKFLRQLYPSAGIVGLDFALGMLKYQATSSLEKRANLVCGNILQLPFPDDYFDLLVSGLAFHWLPNLTGGFQESIRVLKPGGTGLFCFYAKGSFSQIERIYQQVCKELSLPIFSPLWPFPDAKIVHQGLASLPISSLQIASYENQLRFKNITAFFKWLRALGGNTSPLTMLPLSSRFKVHRKVLKSVSESPDKLFLVSLDNWLVKIIK